MIYEIAGAEISNKRNAFHNALDRMWEQAFAAGFCHATDEEQGEAEHRAKHREIRRDFVRYL